MSLILAADIGGTNCRMGLFTLASGLLRLEASIWLPTSNFSDAEALLAAFESGLGASMEGQGALVIALAGPVSGCSGKLTNGDLCLDLGPYMGAGDFRFDIINDFMAQAYAITGPAGEKARHLAGPAKACGDRAVIGAGTGLGCASIVALPDGGWLPRPSEGGHAAFPFAGPKEQEFHAFLQGRLKLPWASCENVLSGRGLELLHLYLTGEELSAAEVSGLALGAESETMIWYSRFYGRVCRDWMLATLCSGGLWIAGGIAAKNPACVQNSHFFGELYGSPRWAELLKAMPLRLLEDENSGLWGAAARGLELLGSI